MTIPDIIYHKIKREPSSNKTISNCDVKILCLLLKEYENILRIAETNLHEYRHEYKKQLREKGYERSETWLE